MLPAEVRDRRADPCAAAPSTRTTRMPAKGAPVRDTALPAPASAARPGCRYLLHVFPSFGVGGVPIRMASVINGLGDRFRHTIVSLNGGVDSRTRLDRGLAIDVRTSPPMPRTLLSRLARIHRCLAGAAPDLLLTYNWGAIEWALANALWRICPHAHLESGFGPEESDRQLRRRTLFRRLALARASQLVVPSHALYVLATRSWRIDPARIRLIPNGVDCARFSAPPGRRTPSPFAFSDAEAVVGTVAPLRAEKNVARLLRVFAALDPGLNARLLVVGDGPERGSLEALASALGIAARTTFVGHVEAVESAFPWLDLFALTSDTEQMPNALLQAMSAGRAVAAVDVGDVKRVLAAENREFVVAPRDEAALGHAIERLLRDASVRAHVGRCNQAKARAEFSLQRMVQAYEAVFQA